MVVKRMVLVDYLTVSDGSKVEAHLLPGLINIKLADLNQLADLKGHKVL